MVDINDVPVPYGIHISRMIRLSHMIHMHPVSFGGAERCQQVTQIDALRQLEKKARRQVDVSLEE